MRRLQCQGDALWSVVTFDISNHPSDVMKQTPPSVSINSRPVDMRLMKRNAGYEQNIFWRWLSCTSTDSQLFENRRGWDSKIWNLTAPMRIYL